MRVCVPAYSFTRTYIDKWKWIALSSCFYRFLQDNYLQKMWQVRDSNPRRLVYPCRLKPHALTTRPTCHTIHEVLFKFIAINGNLRIWLKCVCVCERVCACVCACVQACVIYNKFQNRSYIFHQLYLLHIIIARKVRRKHGPCEQSRRFHMSWLSYAFDHRVIVSHPTHIYIQYLRYSLYTHKHCCCCCRCHGCFRCTS